MRKRSKPAVSYGSWSQTSLTQLERGWVKYKSRPRGRLNRMRGLGYSTTVVVERGRVIKRISDTMPQPISP